LPIFRGKARVPPIRPEKEHDIHLFEKVAYKKKRVGGLGLEKGGGA